MPLSPLQGLIPLACLNSDVWTPENGKAFVRMCKELKIEGESSEDHINDILNLAGKNLPNLADEIDRVVLAYQIMGNNTITAMKGILLQLKNFDRQLKRDHDAP